MCTLIVHNQMLPVAAARINYTHIYVHTCVDYILYLLYAYKSQDGTTMAAPASNIKRDQGRTKDSPMSAGF